MQVEMAVDRCSGERVAVKRVFVQAPVRGQAASDTQNPLREIAALEAARHTNVVGLLGRCRQVRPPLQSAVT
jgi:hypothetical protein